MGAFALLSLITLFSLFPNFIGASEKLLTAYRAKISTEIKQTRSVVKNEKLTTPKIIKRPLVIVKTLPEILFDPLIRPQQIIILITNLPPPSWP